MAWYDDLNKGLGQAGLQQGGFGQAGLPQGGFGQQQAFQPGSVKALRAMREQQQQQQPQAPKKNFFQDNISTAGGIGGALAGAAGGAAIGSVVPGLGTIIGGLIGSVVGGAGGSGAGQLAENAITGEQDLGKGVLQETLLGGLFSAPPIRAARGVFNAAKAAGGLAKSGAGDLAGTAAKSALEESLTRPGVIQNLIGKGGQALQGSGDTLAVKQFRLNPSQTVNFKKKFGEDAGTVIRRYGFQSAEEIAEKGIKPLQDQFTATVANIPEVSTDALRKSFQGKILALSKSASSDNRALAKQLQSEADGILQPLGQTVNPTELNAIKNQFDQLVNYTQKQANPARYGVNKRAADAIRETLQKADPTGTLKKIGIERSKLTQLSDIALKQDELGRGSLPLNLSQTQGAIMGGVATGNPLGLLAGSAGSAVVNSQAGRRIAANSADGLSEALIRAGQRQVNPVSPAGIIGRLGTVGAVSSVANGGNQEVQSNSEAMDMPTTMTNTSMNSNMGSLYNEQPQSANPYPQENLLFDLQRDPANAQAYIQQFQQLQEIFAPAASSQKLNATQIQQANNANSALVDIQAIADAIESDSSIIAKNELSTGPIARGITGTTNYQAAKQNISDVLSRLRSGAAISETELKLYGSLLPELGNSKEDALGKLRRLQTLLQSFATPQPAQADLTSTLIDRGAF